MLRQYELLEKVRAYDPDADEAMINRAYVFSMKAHGSQTRASGDPYYSHPIEVAGILTDLHLDDETIVTAILHDTIEDTVATHEEIERLYRERGDRIWRGLLAFSGDPEVASVGLTEKRAREEGYEVRVGKFPFLASGRAKIAGHTEGFVKVVSDAGYDEVLGVHIIGYKATELIAEAGAVMRLEGTVEELIHTIHAHPTLSEGFMEAAESLLG